MAGHLKISEGHQHFPLAPQSSNLELTLQRDKKKGIMQSFTGRLQEVQSHPAVMITQQAWKAEAVIISDRGTWVLFGPGTQNRSSWDMVQEYNLVLSSLL